MSGGVLGKVQEEIDRITVAAGYPKGTTIPSAARAKLDSSLMLNLRRAELTRDMLLAQLKDVEETMRKLQDS